MVPSSRCMPSICVPGTCMPAYACSACAESTAHIISITLSTLEAAELDIYHAFFMWSMHCLSPAAALHLLHPLLVAYNNVTGSTGCPGLHARLCACLQVGWRRSGLAVWSASGCRLMCSLRQTARPNTFTSLSASSSSAFATDSFKPNALPMEVCMLARVRVCVCPHLHHVLTLSSSSQHGCTVTQKLFQHKGYERHQSLGIKTDIYVSTQMVVFKLMDAPVMLGVLTSAAVSTYGSVGVSVNACASQLYTALEAGS